MFTKQINSLFNFKFHLNYGVGKKNNLFVIYFFEKCIFLIFVLEACCFKDHFAFKMPQVSENNVTIKVAPAFLSLLFKCESELLNIRKNKTNKQKLDVKLEEL